VPLYCHKRALKFLGQQLGLIKLLKLIICPLLLIVIMIPHIFNQLILSLVHLIEDPQHWRNYRTKPRATCSLRKSALSTNTAFHPSGSRQAVIFVLIPGKRTRFTSYFSPSSSNCFCCLINIICIYCNLSISISFVIIFHSVIVNQLQNNAFVLWSISHHSYYILVIRIVSFPQ
jgi:hypothetical protein